MSERELLRRTAEIAADFLDTLDERGFEESAVHEGENGKIVHAEMRFGDGMVMLGQPGRRSG